MGANEQITATTNEGRDNLAAIKGIGPNFSNALYKIGIHRYADFAGYTPNKLSQALIEKAGARVPPERILANDWIGQANMLAQQANMGSETQQPEETEGEQTQSSLTQQAGFSLFFDVMTDEQSQKVWQTRVYHEESGEETIFHGVDPAQWVNWISERANLPPEVKMTYQGTVAAGGPISADIGAAEAIVTKIQKAIQVEIHDVQLSEREPSAETPEKQLMAEVRFRIIGVEAEMLTERRVPSRTEIYLVDNSGISTLVSSRRNELRPQMYEYVSQQSFSFPGLGSYELHALVLLLPPYEGIAYRRGPTFKVAP